MISRTGFEAHDQTMSACSAIAVAVSSLIPVAQRPNR
jgi:hypothetical protein